MNQVSDWCSRADAAGYDAKNLAGSLNVSLRQLERFFQWKMHRTPQKWLNHLRVRRALRLLDGTQNIKQVAAALGYKQASHFSREFTACMGLPPSKVRPGSSFGKRRFQIRDVVVR